MRKITQPIRNVAVILKLSGVSGRDLLAGISAYAHERAHWLFHIFSRAEDFTLDALAGIRELDGIITSEQVMPEVATALESSNIPLVVIGMQENWLRHRHQHLAFVRNNDADIGRLAAHHLLTHGQFRSFAFVPSTKRTYWSLLREKGYRATLRSVGIHADVYIGTMPLRAWLADHPKPCAIFAAFDEGAVEVVTACNELHLDIPKQVAVLGVDNDELLCDFCNPPLSSILPDHNREGFLAARELDALIRGIKGHDGKTVFCRNKRLIPRGSTAPLSPASHLLDETLRYIARHATENLTAEQVVRHLGVSRRLLDLRLHEAGELPLTKLIRHARLDKVARRLRESSLSISAIATACSFSNIQHLSNIFKRRFGTTMTAYRRIEQSNHAKSQR